MSLGFRVEQVESNEEPLTIKAKKGLKKKESPSKMNGHMLIIIVTLR